MPYLPLDLDAKKLIPKVAACTGTTPGHVLWGLSELWEYVWGAKRDTVSELVLAGCFGPSSTMSAALVEFGFLEATADGYRVRGASRFLGVRKAQSDGGKKSKTNLKQFAEPEKGPGADPVAPPGVSRVYPEGEPGHTSGSRPALSPNTQTTNPPAPAPARVALSVPAMPLIERLVGVFLEERRHAYGVGSSDEHAGRELLRLAKGDEAEVERRWRNGLRRKRYPLVSSLRELAKGDVWNHCATDEPASVQLKVTGTTGKATEADKDWSRPVKTKVTEFGEELDLG